MSRIVCQRDMPDGEPRRNEQMTGGPQIHPAHETSPEECRMTYKAPQIERRLRAYGEFLRAPITLTTGVSCTLAQVVEMGPNMGSGSSGGEPSDGGHLMRYYRHRRETGEAIQADEMHRAVAAMRDPLWRKLVNITWVDLPKGAEPRSERVAAEMMAISRDDYRLMRAAMLGYLEAVLYSPRQSQGSPLRADSSAASALR